MFEKGEKGKKKFQHGSVDGAVSVITGVASATSDIINRKTTDSAWTHIRPTKLFYMHDYFNFLTEKKILIFDGKN